MFILSGKTGQGKSTLVRKLFLLLQEEKNGTERFETTF